MIIKIKRERMSRGTIILQSIWHDLETMLLIWHLCSYCLQPQTDKGLHARRQKALPRLQNKEYQYHLEMGIMSSYHYQIVNPDL